MTRLATFIILGFTIIYAQENIIIIDDSRNSHMVQKDIEGCEDSINNQKRQINRLKRELSNALYKLSKIENGISNSNLKLGVDYIIVKVKKGDTLSKYAKRYYGDDKKYYRIYRANRDKIKKDLKIRVGDKIIIPIVKKIKRRESLNKYKNNKYNSKSYIKIENRAKHYANLDEKLKMLDEIVYIDESSDLKQDIVFIPLDDN